MNRLSKITLSALVVLGVTFTQDIAAQDLRHAKAKRTIKIEAAEHSDSVAPLICGEDLKAVKLKLVWNDEFNDGALNLTNWDTIPRGTAHWNRYMSYDSSLIYFEDGNLVLEGRVNNDMESDTSTYVTGGVWSKGKFNFKYGRIDIYAKLGEAKGAWPAFWLLPDVEGRKWPDQGEIDIMEHLNFDEFVYQTAHSKYTVTHGIKDNPRHGGTSKIDREGYNTYSVAWNEVVVVWYVNGKPSFSYKRLYTEQAVEKGQWPFDEAFYILFSQQLGGAGTWVGEIDKTDLPVKMWIDWVRVYQAP